MNNAEMSLLNRKEQIKAMLFDTYKNILTRGGAITNKGTVVACSLNDVDLNQLTPEQVKEYSEKGFIKTIGARAKDGLLPPGRTINNKQRIFIFEDNFVRRMNAKVSVGGAILIFSQKSDSDEEILWFAANSPITAFVKHTAQVLNNEGINGQIGEFPTTLTGKILKNIVDYSKQ